jgi:hypothetical protein
MPPGQGWFSLDATRPTGVSLDSLYAPSSDGLSDHIYGGQTSMTRTTARVGAILGAIILAGCLIKGPEPVPPYYSNIQIIPTSNSRPPLGLEPAPEGRIYQLWLIDFDSAFNLIDQIPSVRFQWNSEYYFAIGENGETLSVTTKSGLDLGLNVLDHSVLGISIEPLNDPAPNSINGPLIMAGLIDEFVRANLTIELGVPVFPTSGAPCQFTMVAPSYLKNAPEACWRDSSEGMGIWFAELEVKDREINDTVALCFEDTCPKDTNLTNCRKTTCSDSLRAKGTRLGMRFLQGQRNIRGSEYYLWIFPSHPESSFSTFDTVFANQEPNLIFCNDVAQHLVGKSGPQVALGENPIVREGKTVGYMYFKPDTTGLVDTCYLRIDVPESTHCTSDTFVYAPFNDTNVIVRTHTYQWADTSYASSLRSLAAAPAPFPLGFFGLEYEAWVVFDSSTGPIKPLSLGRFADKNGLDRSNLHFDVRNLDPRFRFPGEDFLMGIDRPGLPTSNLNLLSLLPNMKVKVWITLEPIENDWAPSEPFRQLIVYSGEILPDFRLDAYRAICQMRGTCGVVPPPIYSLPLSYREVSATSANNNEGHNWPMMRVVLRPPSKK